MVFMTSNTLTEQRPMIVPASLSSQMVRSTTVESFLLRILSYVTVPCCPTANKNLTLPQPDDGPIGDFLRAMGRHPHRSSHIHFMLTAPGYDEYVDRIFFCQRTR
jgi:hypothetical protein